MFYEIVMFGEKSSILGSKSHVVVFHHSSGKIHSGSVGEGGGVIRTNSDIFHQKSHISP